ncbi:hypothetical protein E2C01_079271 [Portunus trituberculatus]|uniref:Uncharacterized protein n=1 Tax=Portunus trituberculatus TaxID=210409 RepID=A0A5B7IL32_PORTR|nr:hypothetical protein [Portunus trituberculatus]
MQSCIAHPTSRHLIFSVLDFLLFFPSLPIPRLTFLAVSAPKNEVFCAGLYTIRSLRRNGVCYPTAVYHWSHDSEVPGIVE